MRKKKKWQYFCPEKKKKKRQSVVLQISHLCSHVPQLPNFVPVYFGPGCVKQEKVEVPRSIPWGYNCRECSCHGLAVLPALLAWVPVFILMCESLHFVHGNKALCLQGEPYAIPPRNRATPCTLPWHRSLRRQRCIGGKISGMDTSRLFIDQNGFLPRKIPHGLTQCCHSTEASSLTILRANVSWGKLKAWKVPSPIYP